jgi:hypothetical protein
MTYGIQCKAVKLLRKQYRGIYIHAVNGFIYPIMVLLRVFVCEYMKLSTRKKKPEANTTSALDAKGVRSTPILLASYFLKLHLNVILLFPVLSPKRSSS